MSSVRRSSRERKQPSSIYSDPVDLENADAAVADPSRSRGGSSPTKNANTKKLSSSNSLTRRKRVAGAISDDDDNEEHLVHDDDADEEHEEEPRDSDEEEVLSLDDDSSSSEDDDDFEPVAAKAKGPAPKKQAKAQPNNAQKTKPKQALSISFKEATASPKRSRRRVPGANAHHAPKLSGTAQRKKLATYMLNASKRILGPTLLQQQDNVDGSSSKDLPLFVQLLQSYKLNSGDNQQSKKNGTNNNRTPLLYRVYAHHEASSLLPQQPYYHSLTGDCLPLEEQCGAGNSNTSKAKPSSVLTLTPKAQALKLEELARSVVRTANNGDVNAAHCSLLNFLFSSLGGACFPPTAEVKAMLDIDRNNNEDDVGDDGKTTGARRKPAKNMRPRMQLLNPETHNLEDMENSTWIDLLHQLVEWMRASPPDQILLCADPHGLNSRFVTSTPNLAMASPVLVMSQLSSPPSVGEQVSREYRRLFSEFWYVLAMVALSDGGSVNTSTSPGTAISSLHAMGMMSPPSDDEVDDDQGKDSSSDDDSKKKRSSSLNTKKKKKRSNDTTNILKGGRMQSLGTPSRFDAAFVRDVIHRVTELVAVGQPDIRAAATVAALQMGHAVLERTIQLRQKLSVAQRQFDAAIGVSNSGGRCSSKDGSSTKKSKATPVLGEKAESLRLSIDSLKRTCEELEELVTGPVMNGIFMHRYRDSHPYIRATCLAALSKMTLQRPDLFLKDKYLKYFGWMMSDKAEVVRYHALLGLLSPFDANNRNGCAVSSALAIASSTRGGAVTGIVELGMLEHVTAKFLKRIASCTRDASPHVQEQAMRLLLLMLRNGFLDELEDDDIWDSINLRAIASKNASHKVRRDALYFIMEQLEPFDQDGETARNAAATSAKSRKSSSKAMNNLESVERTATQRIDALASWLANCLCDGSIPLDQVRVELTDCIVVSLRDMPEHKTSLATNWSAMLRAISDDATATMDGTTVGDRVDVAKQRVLVRFLATAALAEVGAVSGSPPPPSFFGSGPTANDLLLTNPASSSNPARQSGMLSKKNTSPKASSHHPHETLSVALLKALPDLLVKFSSDVAILESLTRLPRYLLPSVFSLPQRHQEFAKLLQRLSNVYLQTQDDEILGNIAVSLAHFGQSDHLRVDDVQQQLRILATSLQTKLLTYIKAASNKNKKHSNNDNDTETAQTQVTETETFPTNNKRASSPRRSSARLSSRSSSSETDQQTNTVATEAEEDACLSFALSIRRLNMLTKRTNIIELLGDNDLAAAEQLTKILTSYLEDMPLMAKRLSHRGNKPSRFFQSMANAFQDGLAFLLCCAGWKLHMLVDALGLIEHSDDDISTKEPANDEDAELYVQSILTLRDGIFSILGHAMNEARPPLNKNDDESEYVQQPSERAFVASMQLTCARVATDLRTLFPKEWSNLRASSKLRELALSNEGQLIATSIRCLNSNKQHLMLTGDEDHEKESVQTLLLPIARSITTNWKGFGNRREAGVALMFLTKAGKESSMLISTMNKHLKRAEPVRFLEAQMACLRQAYDEWINNEPEDLESDHPTEEEMAQYDEAEMVHNQQFRALEGLAAKLSQTLGVGRLSPAIMKGLLGFAKEGIRCAFSTDDVGELILGSRLSFLSLVAKYAVWIKKNKAMRTALAVDLQVKESQLRSHADFAEVHEDDIKSLIAFRVALGLKSSKNLLLQLSIDASMTSGGGSTSGGGMDNTLDTSVAAASHHSMCSTMASTLVSNLGRRKSSTSSVASARSELSVKSSLMSPVFEKESMSTTQTFEGGGEEEDEEDSPMEASSMDSKMQNAFERSDGEREEVKDEGHTTTASSVATESSNKKSNRRMAQHPNATQNIDEEDSLEDEASSFVDSSSNSVQDPIERLSPRKRRRR